jgi:hypothetical protein
MRVWSGRRGLRAVVGAGVATVLAALWPGAPASAEYSSSTQGSYSAKVSEAFELSGLVASPRYPHWYWAHSDVWEPTDTYSACSGRSGTALRECQQTQRTQIWALRIDPVTRQVTDARSFALSSPAWALNPVIAQNNDWEDVALGPPRAGGSRNLVIGAIGDAANNRVRDAAGRDITCVTRRLIELPEPDLSDPGVTTWTPWKIYDIKNPIGLGNVKSCDFESLLVSADGSGTPTAYIVTKKLRKLFARSLAVSSGRDPDTPPATAGSGAPHQPAVSYVGAVRDGKGLQFTAGDSNGTHASLLVRRTVKHPCQILTWSIPPAGLAAALTGTSPAKNRVDCNNMAEGLAYVRNPADPGVVTQDLMAVSDAGDGRSRFLYWYYPDS